MKRYFLEMALIETTSSCNLNCIFCGSDCKSKINPNEFSIKEWRKVVDELSELGAKRVVLSGGEPTLKHGVEDLIVHISRKGIEWGMVSNGMLLTADFLKTAERHKPYAVGISIDGKQETHNKLRGNPQSFQKAVESIKKLKNIEVPVSIITTVHKLNLKELPDILFFVLQNEIYGWQIQLAMPFGRMGERKELLLSQDEFLELCRFVETARKNYHFINIAAADCFAWASAGKIRDGGWSGCAGGLNALGIDSLGNVKGCLSMTGCPPEGNARVRSLIGIWNDPNLFYYNRHFDPASSSELCRKCSKILICKGGCNSQSFSMIGKFHQGVYCYHRSKAVKSIKEAGNADI